jgi:hypothetical protein
MGPRFKDGNFTDRNDSRIEYASVKMSDMSSTTEQVKEITISDDHIYGLKTTSIHDSKKNSNSSNDLTNNS